jgi:uncharacterized protein (TIGR00725 family)
MTLSGPAYVGVVGASQATPQDMEDGEAVGRLLGERGAIIVCGGRGGVMAAASKGCAVAGGTVIGMLPGDDRSDANEWVSVAIPTGLGELRNGLIVRTSDVLIAVGGSYGTLYATASHDGFLPQSQAATVWLSRGSRLDAVLRRGERNSR